MPPGTDNDIEIRGEILRDLDALADAGLLHSEHAHVLRARLARVDGHEYAKGAIHTQGTTPDRPLKEIFTGADFGNLGARD